MMSRKILVTGATGFIGKNLVEKLLEKNFKVKILVRNPNSLPQAFKTDPKLTIIYGDLQNKRALEEAVKGVDVIFHLAATLQVFEKNGEPYRTNIIGLKNLLSVCEKNNHPLRFIFASSIDVEKRQSDYSESKLKGEILTKERFTKHSGKEYIIVRIGNVYTKTSGMIDGIKQMVGKNNWKSSILYHTLGGKHLYLIEINDLLAKLVSLIDDKITVNKTISLSSEEITIQSLVERLYNQKLINRLPDKIIMDSLILKIWQLMGKIFKRADFLIYLSLEK